jgi:DNA-directed RNA polymerase specialized sigma24 family protein
LGQLSASDHSLIIKTSLENKQKDAAKQPNLSYTTTKFRAQRARRELNKLFVQCCQVETDRYGNIITR